MRTVRNCVGLTLVSALLSFGQAANAGPYEDGLAAHQRGDFATAMKLWRPLAEQGNARAQNNLGGMYGSGQGVAQDYKEAVRWYRLAVEQGNAIAQKNLGVMYQEAHGVAHDYKEAVKLFRLSAEQGNALAQGSLGMMYTNGTGVAQDYVQAHMWTNLAAASLSGESVKIGTAFRDALAAKMTPAQIERAQEMARKCQGSKFKDCGW